MPKVWHVNNCGDSNNKINFVWVMSRSTEGWRGLNRIRQETVQRYVQSEVVQISGRVVPSNFLEVMAGW